MVSPTGPGLRPSERPRIWRAAAAAVAERPILGRGAGQDVLVIEEPTPAGLVEIRRDPHNVWLSLAVQTGLVGLGAFALLFAVLWRRTRPWRLDTPEGAVKVALGLALLGAVGVQGLTGSFEDARHLWVLVGLIGAVGRGLGSAGGQSAARRRQPSARFIASSSSLL